MRAIALCLMFVLQPFALVQANEHTVPAAATSHEIVMYATKTCGYCERARQYFVERGIRWKEVDIEESAEGAAQFKKLQGLGTPLIFVDSQRIAGFDRERIDALLAR